MQTIEAMRAIAHDAARNSPGVQRIARAIAADVASETRSAATRSSRNRSRSLLPLLLVVYAFMRERISFKRDTIGVEHLVHPDQLLLEMAQGRTSADCDCASMLGAALLLAMGIPAVFILVSARPDGVLQHVFFGASTRAGVIPLDPQEHFSPGEWPPFLTRRVIVEV